MLVLCHSCNPAFYSLFDCRGWGSKCWIGSEFTAFIPFFSCILLRLFTFLTSFLSIISKTQNYNFLFSLLYIILPLYPTKSMLYFLNTRWSMKCQIGSGFTTFILFFLVFSWTFLPSWSLFCIFTVVYQSVTSYFLFYILFCFGVLPNLYLIFRSYSSWILLAWLYC